MIDAYLERSFKKPLIRNLIKYSLLGLIIGTFLNLFFIIFRSSNNRTWQSILVTYFISVSISLTITFISICSKYFVKKQFKSPLTNIAVYFSLLFTGVLIGSEIGFVFYCIIFKIPFTEINQIGFLKFNLFIGLLVGFIMYINDLQNANMTLNIKEKELQITRLQQLKTEAELNALQARINPHFLYNALNSIASLIPDQPLKAESMTIKLSDLFRYCLNSDSNPWTTVQEEVEMVNTYFEIEKIRFGTRLNFELEIDSEILQRKIPRFIIQPLVENALKHGLKDKLADGLLKIEVKLEGRNLIINVYDNGIPFEKDLNFGYGLKSTMDKLSLLYQDNYKIEFLNAPFKMVHISAPEINQE